MTHFILNSEKNLSKEKMLNFDEISYNSIFSTGNNNGIFNFTNDFQDDQICKEEEFDTSLFLLPEKKLFEKEINLPKYLELNYLIKENEKEELSTQSKKIKFISEKEILEKKTKNQNNIIYRKDAYYKHFKA